ncbi:MAG: ABC transporter ATP-binding protein [Erysipelothrix sp.]|nr:ABC transporter ATP-binding protein [Erysipelothrix sp.]
MKTSYLLKRFLPYYRPYLNILVFDLFCASLTTVAALSLPLIVRLITGTAAESPNDLTSKLILMAGLAYIILRIIETVANYYMQSIGHIMGAKIETDMRRDLFSHIQKMSLEFYNNTKVGHIMSRITSDLSDVTEFAHHGPEELFVATITIGVSFAILSTINLKLTVIIFAFLPFMLFFSRKLHKRMRAGFKRQRVQLGHINSSVEDSLLGIRVVKSFANENLEIDKFALGNDEFLSIKKDVYYTMAQFHSVIRIFDGIMYIVVVVLGAFYVKDGLITVADYMAYLLYVASLLTAIRRIVQFLEQFQRGMTGIERFIEILDTKVDIEDKVDAIDLKDVKGEIRFEHVDFGYKDGSDVLKDFNLSISAGENVALVGPSGGGKTTISNLMQRFYEIDSGKISIDNYSIQDIKLNSLRNNIGVVQQDVYLFSGSVFDNIEYGNPGASHKEIIQAAKLAGAHDFISELTHGYESYVGERGVKLSGGQKQRISIARVFLKNPQILILDEATSALDNENEKLVQDSLEALAKNRTTITIAHRLTTIKNASRIIVLTAEGIEEIGSHQELMNKQGSYYELYRMYEDSN